MRNKSSKPNFYSVGKAILAEGMIVEKWWESPEEEWPSCAKWFGMDVLESSFDGSETEAARRFVGQKEAGDG